MCHMQGGRQQNLNTIQCIVALNKMCHHWFALLAKNFQRGRDATCQATHAISRSNDLVHSKLWALVLFEHLCLEHLCDKWKSEANTASVCDYHAAHLDYRLNYIATNELAWSILKHSFFLFHNYRPGMQWPLLGLAMWMSNPAVVAVVDYRMPDTLANDKTMP